MRWGFALIIFVLRNENSQTYTRETFPIQLFYQYWTPDLMFADFCVWTSKCLKVKGVLLKISNRFLTGIFIMLIVISWHQKLNERVLISMSGVWQVHFKRFLDNVWHTPFGTLIFAPDWSMKLIFKIFSCYFQFFLVAVKNYFSPDKKKEK